MAKTAIVLDKLGFDKMMEAINEKNRKRVLRDAMLIGGTFVQRKIRAVYKSAKPDSDLDRAILVHLFPSGEGAVVRRLYVPGGAGKKYGAGTPYYRSYILNFLEKGAKERRTKGRGKIRNGPKYAGLNRGSIPALRFFARGRGRSLNKAFKEMERYVLVELAKQAREK